MSASRGGRTFGHQPPADPRAGQEAVSSPHTLSEVTAGGGEGYDELLSLAAAELNRLIRRMTQLTARAWSTRREPVARLLQELAVLDAAVESTELHEIPDLPDYALADVTAVIGGDVLETLAATPDPAALDRLIAELRAAWSATR
jgi:hypothetical protein